jgi:hypothetical protein
MIGPRSSSTVSSPKRSAFVKVVAASTDFLELYRRSLKWYHGHKPMPKRREQENDGDDYCR